MKDTFSIKDLQEKMDLSPKDLPGDMAKLAELLEDLVPGEGVRLTLALGDQYRSTFIYFHNFDKFQRKLRNQWIIEQYGEGIKVPEIARKVKLSERHVWEILGTSEEEEKQLSLF